MCPKLENITLGKRMNNMRISEHSISSSRSQVIEDSDQLVKARNKHPMEQPEFNDYAVSYGEEDEASDDESDCCGLQHFALLKNEAARQQTMIGRRNKRRGYNVKKIKQLDILCNASVSSLEWDMDENDDDSDVDIEGSPLRFNSLGRFDARPTLPPKNYLGRFDSMPTTPLTRCDSLDCGMGTMPTSTRRNSDRGYRPESSVDVPLRPHRRESSRWSAGTSFGSLQRDCLLASLGGNSDRNLNRDCLLASVGKAVKLQTDLSADEKNPTNRSATAGPILSDNNGQCPHSPQCRWSPDISRDSMPNVSRRCP